MDLAQARRHSVLCEFIRPYQSHEDIGGFDAKAMADRIVRLERILYALRQPSEAMSDIAYRAYRANDLDHAIQAAVVFAEREASA